MTTTFYTGPAQLELPEGFVDQTMYAFVQPGPTGLHRSIIMARTPLPPDHSLEEFASTALEAQREQLPRFQLLGKRNRKVGGVEAVEYRVVWMRDGVALFQHQVFLRYEHDILALTMCGPNVEAKACEAMFALVLQTIRFRRP